jgi:hypothetical protein
VASVVIGTSTAAAATAYSNQRKSARTANGNLHEIHNDGTQLTIATSADSGATWTTPAAVLSSGNPVAVLNASLHTDLDDYAHLVWKDNGTAGLTVNRIYYMRGTPNAGRTAWTWSAALPVDSSTSQDVPDVVGFRDPAGGGGWFAHIVVSLSGNSTVKVFAGIVTITSAGAVSLSTAMTQRNATLGTSNTSLAYASIDFQHTGDGKTAVASPAVFIAWSNGPPGAGYGIRFRKATYSAGAWGWGTEVEIDSTRYLADVSYWLNCQFDGTRVVIAGMVYDGAANDLLIYERDVADTTTTTRLLIDNAVAANQLLYGSCAYGSDGSLYFVGVDQSGTNGTRLLNWRKWTRSTATLGAITTVDSSTPDAPYVSVKRGYSGSKIDWTYTDGTGSPYSIAYNSINLNAAPNAPTLTGPANNATIDLTAVQRFSWTFSDPDAGDSQSKFDLQYRIGAGSWTTATGTTPNQFNDFAANTFAANTYEWQVRTYDSQGVVGPWSSSFFFTAANPPSAPTITAPISGGTIGVTPTTVTWSFPTQQAWQVRRVADSAGAADATTIYYDSGQVTDTITRALSLAFPTNSRYEHIQVRIRSSGLWSTWADVRVQVSYTPPTAPTMTATFNTATASVAVVITNPAGGTAVSYNDVYRNDGSGEIRIATSVAANGTFTDWTPAAGVNIYRIVAVGTNGTSTSS